MFKNKIKSPHIKPKYTKLNKRFYKRKIFKKIKWIVTINVFDLPVFLSRNIIVSNSIDITYLLIYLNKYKKIKFPL